MNSDSNYHTVEEAALNAWPGLSQLLFDGWLLRFSEGYTRRANSVNLLYPARHDLSDKIAACEDIYMARDLPPIFRLTSYNAEAQALDMLLVEAGYQIAPNPTDVLSLDLSNRQPPRPTSALLQQLPVEAWLALFANLSETPPENHAIHRRILQAIPSSLYLLAVSSASQQVVACGLAVLERDTVGLFDIVTGAAHRRQGYGTQVVAGLLDWAVARGAKRAYLQVVQRNRAAQQLYKRLGFIKLYDYWYRIPGDDNV